MYQPVLPQGHIFFAFNTEVGKDFIKLAQIDCCSYKTATSYLLKERFNKEIGVVQ